ncbi:MAG: T9SS C-terminal target domain-containing protein [Bacteroidetes bacterium]|nr:MAG: T9SS C-terminal target domain-containing protein [Bacteroidota bacterium]
MNLRRLLIALSCCWALFVGLGGQFVRAQTSVFPGDANANGRVDHYDLLPIGYAFGQFGPARIQVESTTIPQGVPQSWSQDFATGVNYIHADANGDGLVSIPDVALISLNFGLELDTVQSLTYSSTDSPSGAQISLNHGEELPPFVEGTTVDIPLRYELAADDPTALNGIAFTLTYEPAHFEDVQLYLNPGWLLADGGGTSLVRHEAGKVHLALTRFGPNPVGGSGDIGIIRMIIIDDLVSLLETPADTLRSDVEVWNIQAYDGHYELVPIACPQLALRMYCDRSTGVGEAMPNLLGARLFPNPVANLLSIRSEYAFSQLAIVSTNGQTSFLYQGNPRYAWQAELSDLPAGLYFIRLSGAQGTSMLKLVKHKQ